MIRTRLLYAGLLLVALGINFNHPGEWGISQARAEGQTVRSEVGAPLKEAQNLLKARRYPEALAKIRDADAVPSKTAYESSVIEKMRLSAANGAGDPDTAARSLSNLNTGGLLSPTERSSYTEAVIGAYIRAKDYRKAMALAQEALKSGGSGQLRTLLIQAMYFAGDTSGAIRELNAEIAADDRAGRAPSEDRLNLLANCYAKINDNAGFARVLERLVTLYPKKDTWKNLLNRAQKRSGVSDRYALDFYRLQFATGNVSDASEYVEMSQLALQAGVPMEAKKIIDEGFAKKILGTGNEAERHKRLSDLAAKQATEEQKVLAKGDFGGKDADGLVTVGYSMVSAGQYQKGIALIEQGIAKGGLKRPDEAKLHLGIAYLQAGDRAKAVRTLKTVQGTDGGADVARLWILYSNKG